MPMPQNWGRVERSCPVSYAWPFGYQSCVIAHAVCVCVFFLFILCRLSLIAVFIQLYYLRFYLVSGVLDVKFRMPFANKRTKHSRNARQISLIETSISNENVENNLSATGLQRRLSFLVKPRISTKHSDFSNEMKKKSYK